MNIFWPQLPKFLTHRPVGESWFNCKHLFAHFWADLAARLSHFWKKTGLKTVSDKFAKYHFQHVGCWWSDSGTVIIVNINNHFPYDSPFRTDKCQINFGMMHRWTWKNGLFRAGGCVKFKRILTSVLFPDSPFSIVRGEKDGQDHYENPRLHSARITKQIKSPIHEWENDYEII